MKGEEDSRADRLRDQERWRGGRGGRRKKINEFPMKRG